jgi:hypothetical protein
MNDLEMTPRAFAIWMAVLAVYFAIAFWLIFAATTYSPNFALESAELLEEKKAVRVAITFKEIPRGNADEIELGIWAPDGPPFHSQEVRWAQLAELDSDPATTPASPPRPGTRSTFEIPLDAENRARLERRSGSDAFEVQFHWGWSRYVRIDISE